MTTDKLDKLKELYMLALNQERVNESLRAENEKLKADRVRQVGLKVIDEHALRAQLAEANTIIKMLLMRGPTTEDHNFTNCTEPSCSVARTYLEKYK